MRAALIEDAERRWPQEACGVVVLGGMGPQVVPLPNVSATPTTAFELHPLALLRVARASEIAAIYHSHPEGPASLSDTDRRQQRGPDGPLWPGVEQWVLGMRAAQVVDLGRFVWDSRRRDYVPTQEVIQ